MNKENRTSELSRGARFIKRRRTYLTAERGWKVSGKSSFSVFIWRSNGFKVSIWGNFKGISDTECLSFSLQCFYFHNWRGFLPEMEKTFSICQWIFRPLMMCFYADLNFCFVRVLSLSESRKVNKKLISIIFHLSRSSNLLLFNFTYIYCFFKKRLATNKLRRKRENSSLKCWFCNLLTLADDFTFSDIWFGLMETSSFLLVLLSRTN